MGFFTTLLINLVIAGSVVVFGWSATPLLLLYWGENVIIGLITLAKILVCGCMRGGFRALASVFNTGFFIFHYGMFCAVHATLIFALTDPGGEPRPDVLAGVVLRYLEANPVLLANLALLGAFHLFQFVAFWLMRGEWRRYDSDVVMYLPYGRVIVVHIALLCGGLIAVQLGQPVIVVFVLAVLKSLLEAAAQTAAAQPKEPANIALAGRQS